MTTPESPAPSDLGASGGALYSELTTAYTFEAHETALVLEICRVRDRLDALDADVREHGVTVESPQGRKTSPSLVEARATALVLARLVTALRLPDEETGERAQRRTARGVYSITGQTGPRIAKPGPRSARGSA